MAYCQYTVCVGYYVLDLVDVAAKIATQVAGTDRVLLFGSRKYPGKVRSDVDLLVFGPTALPQLSDFRSSDERYEPLDLWLAHGTTAMSAVNGSTLPVDELTTFELYPRPDSRIEGELRYQRVSR